MQKNIFLTLLTTLLSAAILYITVHQLDPFGPHQSLSYGTLLLGLFCGVSSFCTLLFFFGLELVRGGKLGTRSYIISLRRGMWLGIFATSVVGLQLIGLMRPFEMGLLALFLFAIELIFIGSE